MRKMRQKTKKMMYILGTNTVVGGLNVERLTTVCIITVGVEWKKKKYVLMKMKLHFEKNYLRVCAVFCVSKVFVCLSKKKKLL